MNNHKIIGKIGLTPKGIYNQGTAYNTLDVVYYNGASYISLIPNNSNTPSDQDPNWAVMTKDGQDSFRGELTPQTVIEPGKPAYWFAAPGTYPNAGGVTVTSNNTGIVRYDGVNFTISEISGEYVGVAEPNSPAPPAIGFNRYIVHTAGTYTNFKDSGNAAIVVTTADLDVVNGVARNEVILEVSNGVATKRVRRLMGDAGPAADPAVKSALKHFLNPVEGEGYENTEITSYQAGYYNNSGVFTANATTRAYKFNPQNQVSISGQVVGLTGNPFVAVLGRKGSVFTEILIGTGEKYNDKNIDVSGFDEVYINFLITNQPTTKVISRKIISVTTVENSVKKYIDNRPISFLGILNNIPDANFGLSGQNAIVNVDGFDWLYSKDHNDWHPIYQLTRLQQGIFKLSSGLIFSENFQSTNKWSSPITVRAKKSYTSFGKLSGKVGAEKAVNDAMGRREAFIFIDDDGKWYLTFDSSENTSLGWRPQMHVSDDRGLTWKNKGALPIGYSDGTGGQVAGRSILYMTKYDGVYYMYTLTSGGHSNSIPTPPYFSDVWKYAGNDLENANWVFVRKQLLQGSEPYTQNGAYLGSIVKNAAQYYLFFSAGQADNYSVGLAKANAPDGVATKNAVPVLPELNDFIIENPRVFWSAFLSKWVMLNNTGRKSEGKTTRNYLNMSDNLDAWTYDGENTAIVSNLDGEVAVGIHVPLIKSNGQHLEMPDGRIPLIYDLLDSADVSGSIGNHTNRSLYYTVLEPATSELCKGLSSIYANSFISQNTANTVLTSLPEWQGVSNTGAFVIQGKNSVYWGQLVVQGAEALAINSHVFASNADKTVSVSFNINNDSRIGLVFNFVDAQNYDVVYLPVGQSASVYQGVNGVFTETIDGLGIAETAKHVCLELKNNKWNLVFPVLNGRKIVEVGNLVPNSKCGLRHSTGVTGVRFFEISDGVAETVLSKEIAEAGVFEFAAFNENYQSNPFEFRFRVTDSNNYYFLSYSLYNSIVLGRTQNGVSTTLANSTLADVLKFPENTAIRVRVEDKGATINCTVNGVLLHAVVEPVSGKYGFNLRNSTWGIRNFRFYRNNEIKLVGAPVGQQYSIWSAGVCLQKGFTNDNNAITLAHFPVDEIHIGDDKKIFSEKVWGGDVINWNP